MSEGSGRGPDQTEIPNTGYNRTTPQSSFRNFVRRFIPSPEQLAPQVEQVPVEEISIVKVAEILIQERYARGRANLPIGIGVIENALGWSNAVPVEQRRILQDTIKSRLYALSSEGAIHANSAEDKKGNRYVEFSLQEGDREKLQDIINKYNQ